MGIRGLTTFIQSRSHLYMNGYELHDTSLVLDGNSVACQLYRWHTQSNDCYGGDYDKFSNVILHFFQLLDDCNITPYVVFDGGYENRKVATVVSRMKNKIRSADELNSVTEGSISVFPLLVRVTFLDIVLKLNIKTVRCDFEGDSETANIARALNCPVLSYDSDFFILDVLYIPFHTLDLCVKKRKSKINSETYRYISCEIYQVEKFLSSFPGLDKTCLPVLAVLLGNDYIKRSVFALFFHNLKMQKSHGKRNEEQRRIKSLLIWLQNETTESALKKVLGRYKKEKRKLISDKIQNAIQAYNHTDSEYLKYLGLIGMATENCLITNENLIEDSDEENEEDQSEEESSEDDETLLDEKVPEINSPPIFSENFRQCIYPPCFINILQHKYYCSPQVENSDLPHSHVISFDILSAIHKILTNSDKHLICIGRKGNEQVGKQEVPLCGIDLPTLADIQDLNVDQRKHVFYKILNMDESSYTPIEMFPESWHLFVMAIKYLISRSSISWPLVYSLLLCRLILNHVDKKIGFHRSIKEFNKKFGMGNESTSPLDGGTAVIGLNIRQALDNITVKDSESCMKVLIPYFEMDAKNATNKSFDRNLVHSLSQFQSCLMHVDQLNVLLNSPFPSILVSECLNCTFVYNSTKNFSKRTNIDEYTEILLQNSTTVMYSYSLMIEKIRKIAQDNVMSNDVIPKKRKKKFQWI
ncbi:hypothetical protein JTB14_031517 [Gonioctena quinquepunctata]|nr:hypothetical protein JTB14_031517 [Gonioctena quinquepunctata]